MDGADERARGERAFRFCLILYLPEMEVASAESADGHLPYALTVPGSHRGRVRATPGVLSMAGRTTDGPDGRTD